MKIPLFIEYFNRVHSRCFRDEIRELKALRKDKTLAAVYDYLGFKDEHADVYSEKWREERYLLSDSEIIAKVKGIYGGGQGDSISCTEYFNDRREKLGEIHFKPNICALTLAAPWFDSENHNNVCVDPRVVATDIFVNALAMMRPASQPGETLVDEINAVLNPTFSDDEALEFLEKNRFVGENSKKKLFEEKKRNGTLAEKDPLSHEVWDGDEFPGWWTSERDALGFVPRRMRGVHEKFRNMWERYCLQNGYFNG